MLYIIYQEDRPDGAESKAGVVARVPLAFVVETDEAAQVNGTDDQQQDRL